MGPAPSGSLLQAAAEKAMAGGLCLPVTLCHLWLCLSRTAALLCYQGPLSQEGPGPWPSPSPVPSPNPTPSVQKCSEEEVCHQTLLLVHTGPLVASFRSKGCTPPGPQGTGVSHYRQPPEVSLTVYNHVCSTDLCNSPEAEPWNLSTFPAPTPGGANPGPLLCPACVAPHSCPEDSPLVSCPPQSRCYQGMLHLMSSDLSLPLAVWGCGSWTNCSLMDGFWMPGPIGLRESCENEAEMRALLGQWPPRGRGAWLEPRLAGPGSLGAPLALWAVLPYPVLSPWDLGF